MTSSWYDKVTRFDAVTMENQKLRKRIMELESSLVDDETVKSNRDKYLHVVAKIYGTNKLELRSPCRMAVVTEARQVLYFLLAQDCAMSQTQIGRYLNRDHSTVCHGIETARRRYQHKIEEVRREAR